MMLIVGLLGAGGVLYALYHYGRGLPEYSQLADYEPPTVTRVHAGDGRLLAEYATEKRVYVPVSAIPRRVRNAFLSAEDKNFYSHPGVDFLSVVRAVVTNIANLGSSRRPVGASTITQQVAKNFLLTNEVSYERKIKEAILAFRIEQAFTKDTILELYLNEIYLGFGSYGVAAAALNYFNKSLDELTVRRGRLSGGPAQGAQQLSPRPQVRSRGGAAQLGDRAHARRRAHRRAGGRGRQGSSFCLVRGRMRPRWLRPSTSPKRCGANWRGSTATTVSTGGLSVRTTLDPAAGHRRPGAARRADRL